jgi:hypothetical protein
LCQNSKKRESLDDILLSALLIRVNYKAVTRTINQESRDRVLLLALQGSLVLEIVDMKDSFSRRIDLVSVLPILRTMFPFKLFHVWRFHALIAANPWSKRECSLLQISADVRYNAAPVVITFVIVVAACLA